MTLSGHFHGLSSLNQLLDAFFHDLISKQGTFVRGLPKVADGRGKSGNWIILESGKSRKSQGKVRDFEGEKIMATV